MSPVRTEDIEEVASGWLVRRDSGQWTPADQAHFEQWLEASTLNRVAFLRLELSWEESARLKALGAGVAAEQPPRRGKWNLSPFFAAQPSGTRLRAPATGPLGRWQRAAIAASVVLAVACGFGAYDAWDGGSDRYATPVGGIASMPLLDGSNITLNTNSQVRVELTKAERHIDLKQGEVFFEVAKDPNRPFVVAAGNKRVIAVGTKFSVLRNGDSVEVVVTEGKVRMEDASPDAAHRDSAAAHGSASPRGAVGPVYLTAGAVALADDGGVIVERKSLEEAETHLSWRSGVLMFRDLSLADAAAEFNRYNVRKIVISDPAAGALRVEGNFRATNVEAFVRLLENYFPLQVANQGDDILLSSH